MLVVLDSDPDSLAPLAVAQSYSPSTVLLTSWAADPMEIDAEVLHSTSAEPTVGEAVRVAAQRGLSWIGMRRSLLPPREMLGELLVATAQYSNKGRPGFGVFLTEGEPRPFKHILAVVDRSHGPVSGMLAYAGVAIADAAGAQLDILVIGAGDENPHTEDELDAIVINREQELYEAAIQRAVDAGVSVHWITAASVTDQWPVVADQLSQHPYDLVIDDLGDVSLARVRQRGSIQQALATHAVGNLPLQLLTQTSLPVLLVLDQVRMRWVPDKALRTGAVAAITLGVMSAPVASGLAAAAPVPAAASVEAPDKTGDPVTDLNVALEVAAEQAEDAPGVDVASRVGDATAASRSGSGGARAVAQSQAGQGAAAPADSGSPTGYPESLAPSAPAQVSTPAVTSETSETSRAETRNKKKQGKTSQEPPKAKAKAKEAPPVQVPSGGASPTQVARAQAAAYSQQQELQREQAKKSNVQESVAELTEQMSESEAGAIVARDHLEAATLSHAEAAAHSEAVEEAASGVGAILPGAPAEEDVTAAVLAERAAGERLETAIETGAEVLDDIAATERKLTKTRQQLGNRKADIEASRVDYAHAKEKADAYKASLAASRQSPVAKGNYRLTARYGQGGGLWSSGVHTGLDFAGPTGTPIMAAASGTVVSTGYAGAYGNQVVIAHGNGLRTTYSHLSSIGVTKGQKVSTGDQIGRMGSTGNSTGSHLHFEVESNGSFQNPESWLGW